MQHKKTLRQRDIALFCVSAVVTVDTLAAGAAMGPQVLFWWLFCALVFFVPYALMTAELGCSYPEQGGIYAWVRDAYGERWAARVAWSYWVNVAVWLPAIFILFAGVFAQMFFPSLSLTAQIAIGIVLSWLCVLINAVTLEVGKWVPNLGAIVKITIIAVLIVAGFLHAGEHGSANDLSFAALLPSSGDSLQYLPVLIIGMVGFELVCAGSDEMVDPARDVPRSMLSSGAIIIVLYMLATAAILVAIPAAEINLVNGLLDTLRLLLGDSTLGSAVAWALGLAALYQFFSNGVTWALGSNRAAAEAAQEGELPAFLGRESSSGTPLGAAIALGAVSTVILLLYGGLAGSNQDLFWSLFAFSSVILLLPYVVLCPAFLKLRARDAQRPRPFSYPGPRALVTASVALCGLVLTVTVVLFCWVPEDGVQWPVLLGSVALVGAGEVLVRRAERKRTGAGTAPEALISKPTGP